MSSPVFSNDTSVVSVNAGYGIALITIGLFSLLNYIISFIGVPTVILHNATKNEDIWKWKNLSLSWLHASIIGLWVLSCFYFYPEIWQDLVTYISPFTYYMVAVSTGYFVYDFGDLILQRQAFKMWELSLHHIAVISIFVYNLTYRTCIGYTVVALLTEVNSIFLHLRKLMQMLRVPFSSWPYRANAAVNLVSFLVFRGYALASISIGMVAQRHRLDPWYLGLLGGAMFVMNMINPALFVILVKSDVLRGRQRKSQRQVEANGKKE